MLDRDGARLYPVVLTAFVGLGVGVRTREMGRAGEGEGERSLHLLRTNPAAQ